MRPSKRLVDQRVRNRIMDALSLLAEGGSASHGMRQDDAFEFFYDWVDDAGPGLTWPKSAPGTMTHREVDAVSAVLSVINAAAKELNNIECRDFGVRSGFQDHVSHIAQEALDLMLARGCFDEEKEEGEPSNESFAEALRS